MRIHTGLKATAQAVKCHTCEDLILVLGELHPSLIYCCDDCIEAKYPMAIEILKQFEMDEEKAQKTIATLTRKKVRNSKWQIGYSLYATLEEAEKAVREDYDDHEILIIDLGPLPE